MEIKISKWTLFWKGLFGGKRAIAEYLLDVANKAVSHIPDATKDEIVKLRDTIGNIRSRLATLDWLVPANWEGKYKAIILCFDTVFAALYDGRVTADELDGVIDNFKKAYAEFAAAK